MNFVCHAPRGTALHHESNQGWTVTDHLLAQVADTLQILLWTKTEDAQKKRPKHKPKPMLRPGMVMDEAQEEKPMTVAEYAARTGMVMEF